jgi:hypothetical protein
MCLTFFFHVAPRTSGRCLTGSSRRWASFRASSTSVAAPEVRAKDSIEGGQPAAEKSPARKQRVLSGVQPTGSLHLGNYLGAIKNWVKLQDTFETFFCVVDLHAVRCSEDHTVECASCHVQLLAVLIVREVHVAGGPKVAAMALLVSWERKQLLTVSS